jgi:nucleoside-diphosphate-sugar epimerase
MIVAGAPGHVGRHLLDAIRADYQVYGLANCLQTECGAPDHPRVTWFETDVADRQAVEETFRRIGEDGGVDLVIYLVHPPGAGGEIGDETRRVNIDGLRNVLDASRALKPKRFVLASAEVESPESGEEKAPDPIATILREYKDHFPTSRIRFASRPRAVIVGASGFIGRHLIDAVKEDYQVLGLARSSQEAARVPAHPNVSWHQVDIGDREAVEAVFGKIKEGGGADVVVHLAAYYDYTGDDHPSYRRTNIDGLRNVLDACRPIRPRSFLFASSVAASEFPPPGVALDESSPPDGTHPYAVSKRVGEEMLGEYRDDFPSIIVRLGAVYSDWCEYPPVFMQLERWRSRSWDRRILGGRGRFAIPYVHVRDVQTFFTRAMGHAGELEPGEVLIASTDAPVPMCDLFELVTKFYFGGSHEPLHLPKPLCFLGMYARDVTGRFLGRRPFERPWMAGYIDRRMPVDAARTRDRLGWSPRERFDLLRRIPFLVENLKSNPAEWHRRNQAIMRRDREALNLRIHRLLESHERGILEELERRVAAPDREPALARHAGLPTDERQWTHRAALHQLMNSVRTLDMAVYLSFCRDLAERRFSDGFVPGDIGAVLRTLGDACATTLLKDAEAAPLQTEIRDRIEMTTLFGCDQVEESFDALMEAQVRRQQRIEED